MAIEWGTLLTTYRERAGRWPQRIYLHPADYQREQDARQDEIIAVAAPDAAARAALWGVPIHVTPLVPETVPLLWPPQGTPHA